MTRDLDETTITRAVLERLEGSATPRTRAISEAVVRHLHALVRELRPTLEEWSDAVDFLTRTGQTCSDTRQEFILLSDALGVSMLVDAVNHGDDGRATETTVLGPFYVGDPPLAPLGADLAGGAPGEPLLVSGVVRGPDGAPLAGATVDTWQADEDGYYDVQRGDELELRARLWTDAAGRYWFWAVVPASYPIPDDGPVGELLRAQGRHPYRPAHVHFRIAAPGCRELITHVFLAGDEYLDSDVVFGVKQSLVAPVERVAEGVLPDGAPVARSHARLTYDFALAETGAPRAGAAASGAAAPGAAEVRP